MALWLLLYLVMGPVRTVQLLICYVRIKKFSTYSYQVVDPLLPASYKIIQVAAGIAAKIVFKSWGPYRLLEPTNPGSYCIQKLPFLEGLGYLASE
jgi:hypothetical protein